MKLQIRWNVPSISPYSFRSRRVITSTTRTRSSSYCDKPFILPPTARDINSEIKYFLWVLEACCRSLMPAIGLTGSFRFVTSMSITPRTTSMPRWTSRSYAFPSLLCLYMFLCLCFAMLSFSECSYILDSLWACFVLVWISIDENHKMARFSVHADDFHKIPPRGLFLSSVHVMDDKSSSLSSLLFPKITNWKITFLFKTSDSIGWLRWGNP